jgi:hypothetical protein
MQKKKLFLLFLLFVNQFIIINSQEEQTEQTEKKNKKPKAWSPERLYKYLNETYLHPNNPNYEKNIKYMLFDPEFYVQDTDIQEAENGIQELSDKYNVSLHIFLISKLRSRNKTEEEYTNFVERLSNLIKSEHKGYNDNLTLTAVFFIKDEKTKVKITPQLKKRFSDSDIANLIHRRKKDLLENNYQGVANGFVKEIFKIYQRKIDNPNMMVVLFYTILFIIGLTIVVFFLNRESISEQEYKIKGFLDKMKDKSNPKEIFNESCLICLEAFKNSEELKKIENSGKKEEFEKVEIITLECGHKLHKNCKTEWMKKYEICPICRLENNIKEKNKGNKKNIGDNDNVNYNQILVEILRIQAERNYLTDREIVKVRRMYHRPVRTINLDKKISKLA